MFKLFNLTLMKLLTQAPIVYECI